MKKFLTFLLIGWFTIFYTGYAYAGTITYTTLSSDSGVSFSHFNDSFTTIYNEFNGQIDSNNIASGGVTSDDIATSANPLVRDNENIGEYVFTGLTLPSSGTKAAAAIALGTAYVSNDGDATLHRVVMAATNIASILTDSSVNWIYLSFNGQYSALTGATQPTTPTNTIVLGSVTVDGGTPDVTAASESVRQTSPPNLRIYTSYIMGCLISRDITDTDQINILSGDIEFGTGADNFRRNTSTVAIDFDVTGRGGLDTGSLAADTFYYIFALPDDANASNFEGIASLSNSDASGVTGERLIGWCYSSSTTVISPDSLGAYKNAGSNQPNFAQAVMSGDVNINNGAWRDVSGCDNLKFYSSGRPIQIFYAMSAVVGGAVTQPACLVEIDGVDIVETEQRSYSAASGRWHVSNTYVHQLDAGEHTAQLQAFSDSTTDSTALNRILRITEF